MISSFHFAAVQGERPSEAYKTHQATIIMNQAVSIKAKTSFDIHQISSGNA
ncbi:MAG: hypothetical protein ACOZBL_05680 [Patescibacteria group bacterium]